MSSASQKSTKSKKAKKGEAKVVEEVEKVVKKEVKRVEKAAHGSPKKPKAKAPGPSVKVPTASVLSRRGTEMIAREGRGFSIGELSGAGLTPAGAVEWGARVDYRRRSVIESNVSALKGWAARAAASAKAETEPEKAGRALEGVGEEVVAEAEKAEKVVKKAAKKVEKGAKQKLEKPRAKKPES